MSATPTPPAPKWRLQLARILALAFVVAVTVGLYLLGNRSEELEKLGYLGAFLLSLFAYATIILPAPGLTIVFALGGKFAPLGIGLAAGAGAALGELSGYLAGFSGQAIIENRGMYERLSGWMQRYGPITITLLALIPSPFFDLVGFAAGALKMPVLRFLFWCAIGQCLKMIAVAYAGAYSIDWVTRWFD